MAGCQHTDIFRDWATTVAKCKDQPADVNVKKDAIPDVKVDEEAERKWLSEMERVEASVFEGKKLAKAMKGTSNREIAQEYFNKEDRRVGKNTTVMVDGFAISKESMNCAWGEAIPTLAGKDPRLAEPKRGKKAAVTPQEHCQVCIDGGELHICQLCPRAFHYDCLDHDYKSKAKGWQFSCPQHQCFDCRQGTQDAGGMLYRCRWCERAYCEDCMDFEKSTLLGNTLQEYELLDYPEGSNAFYIQCAHCTDHFTDFPEDKKLCDHMAREIALKYELTFGDNATDRGGPSDTPSLTDGTTTASTPFVIDDDEIEMITNRKRKLKQETVRPAKKMAF